MNKEPDEEYQKKVVLSIGLIVVGLASVFGLTMLWYWALHGISSEVAQATAWTVGLGFFVGIVCIMAVNSEV